MEAGRRLQRQGEVGKDRVACGGGHELVVVGDQGSLVPQTALCIASQPDMDLSSSVPAQGLPLNRAFPIVGILCRDTTCSPKEMAAAAWVGGVLDVEAAILVLWQPHTPGI